MNILVSVRGFDTRNGHAVGNFELDQAKALKAAGHDVRIAAIDTRSVRHGRPFGFYSYELSGIPVFYGSVPCGGLPLGLPAMAGNTAARGIYRCATRDGWRPDVIHQHFARDFGVIANEKRIPFVFTEHSSTHNKLLPPKEARELREEYRRADVLIAVSSSLARIMERNTGLHAQVVPNVVDTATFCRERIPHKGFHFVSAGNLIPVKGFDLLIRAFAALPENARLSVFGRGPEEASLRSLIGELGVGDRVALRGHCPREELAETYAEADCFVLASQRETFGLAYVEAMASGLPVIATRCGGPEDFMTPETGLMIPTDDVTALTEAMEQMMVTNDPYDAFAISQAACSQYSPERIAQCLTEIYEGFR